MEQPPSSRSSNVTFNTEREAKRRFLLSAVDQIRDVVRNTADEAEKSRTLPGVLFDAMYETGLFWMKLPEVLGGAEADPLIQVEVLESLARLAASAAWNVMIGSQSIALPGSLTLLSPKYSLKVTFRWRREL